MTGGAHGSPLSDAGARGKFVWSARELFGSDALRRKTGLDRITDGWGTDLEAESIAGEAAGEVSRSATAIRETTVANSHRHEHPLIAFLCGKRDLTVDSMEMLTAQIHRWSARAGRLPVALEELGDVENRVFPIARVDAWGRPLRLRYALRVRSLGADHKLYGLDDAADLSAMFVVRDERGRWLHGDEIEVLEPMRQLRGVKGELPAEWGGLELALGRDGRILYRAPLIPPIDRRLPWTFRFDDVAEEELTLFAGDDVDSDDPADVVSIGTVTPHDGMIVAPKMTGRAARHVLRVVDASTGAPWVCAKIVVTLTIANHVISQVAEHTDANGSCSFDLSSIGMHRIEVIAPSGQRLLDHSFPASAIESEQLLVVPAADR